jgi:hypothetical protein
MGVDRQSRNGDGEQTGVCPALRLGGLSTTPSSTSPFEKSKAAEAALVAEYIKYGFENWDGTQSPCIDPELYTNGFTTVRRTTERPIVVRNRPQSG